MEVKATVKKLFEVCKKFEQQTDWDKYIRAVESGKWSGIFIRLCIIAEVDKIWYITMRNSERIIRIIIYLRNK